MNWFQSIFGPHDAVPVIPGIPFSVTGQATIFGLDYHARNDRTDNGVGAFGYNTRDPRLIGCSLPIPVLLQSIGRENFGLIRRRQYLVSIHSHYSGKTITGVPIVDEGPAMWTGNCIDLTYGAVQAIGDHDNAICTYWILGADGKPVQIKGWAFSTHNIV